MRVVPEPHSRVASALEKNRSTVADGWGTASWRSRDLYDTQSPCEMFRASHWFILALAALRESLLDLQPVKVRCPVRELTCCYTEYNSKFRPLLIVGAYVESARVSASDFHGIDI